MQRQLPGAASWAIDAVKGLARTVVLVLASMIVPAIWAALAAVCFLWRANPWSWIAPIVFSFVFGLLLSRPIGRLFRVLVGRWTGTVIRSAYREVGPVTQMATGYWWNGHSYERSKRRAQEDLQMRLRFTDPAVWRDLRWLAIAPVTVGLVAAVPLAGIVGAIIAFVQPFPLAIAIGGLLLVVGIGTAPYAWRILEPVATRWLQPSPNAEFSDRVRELTEQRADATVAQAAEIRRIERDLHDGAQARLVALGLSLATAEKLMETDTDAAKRLLREARDGASTSLGELRELVRGITPPVLNERGLVDALRALALDSPLDVEVSSSVKTPADAPIESALYFGTSEVLTNTIKHAAATRARIRIRRDARAIVVEIEDNGHGGAAVADGGGLAGLRRRLAVFDGTLAVSSPAGGPTRVTMMVPCESS
jgi:signal transduction histidine kinase